MKKLSESVVEFLNNEGINFSQIDDQTAFEFNSRCKSGRLSSIIYTEDEDSLVACFTSCPQHIPSDRISAMSEFITMVNWKLHVGLLSMDVKTGVMQSYTSLRLGHIELDHDTVKNLFFQSLATMDIYMPAILAIAFGNKTPQEAMGMLYTDSKPAQDEPDSDQTPPARRAGNLN